MYLIIIIYLFYASAKSNLGGIRGFIGSQCFTNKDCILESVFPVARTCCHPDF